MLLPLQELLQVLWSFGVISRYDFDKFVTKEMNQIEENK